MEYKNPSIIPGTFADTNGCHDCYQFVAMHCNGVETCRTTWNEWCEEAIVREEENRRYRRL